MDKEQGRKARQEKIDKRRKAVNVESKSSRPKNMADWLDRRGKHYQPISGFEEEYIEKGKITKERVEGFKRILDSIISGMGTVDGETVLDIGSNLGYFCFELTKRGARTIGVERNVRYADASKAISKRLGCEEDNPQFIAGDIIGWLEVNEHKFDYVLLLNVFHHILVADEGKAWEMFNGLLDTTKGIFIMMRSKLKDWSLKYTRDIPKSILEQSDATEYETFDRVHGRTIYLFRKS